MKDIFSGEYYAYLLSSNQFSSQEQIGCQLLIHGGKLRNMKYV